MPGGSLAMQGSEGPADNQQRALLDNPVDKTVTAITDPMTGSRPPPKSPAGTPTFGVNFLVQSHC